ncbi:MAG: LytR C-terminal domain-containing protein [Gemmatimonadota bacterium]
MTSRLHTAFTILVLLAVGALLGSFWLGWRNARLTGEVGGDVRGVPASAPDALAGRVSVEVLNGSGDPGAARRVAERLREMGFDVKTFGNAQSFAHSVTSVLDRSGRPGAARRIADSLGVTAVVTDRRPDLYLDATVILGRDWRRLIPDPARP